MTKRPSTKALSQDSNPLDQTTATLTRVSFRPMAAGEAFRFKIESSSVCEILDMFKTSDWPEATQRFLRSVKHYVTDAEVFPPAKSHKLESEFCKYLTAVIERKLEQDPEELEETLKYVQAEIQNQEQNSTILYFWFRALKSLEHPQLLEELMDSHEGSYDKIGGPRLAVSVVLKHAHWQKSEHGQAALVRIFNDSPLYYCGPLTGYSCAADLIGEYITKDKAWHELISGHPKLRDAFNQCVDRYFSTPALWNGRGFPPSPLVRAALAMPSILDRTETLEALWQRSPELLISAIFEIPHLRDSALLDQYVNRILESKDSWLNEFLYMAIGESKTLAASAAGQNLVSRLIDQEVTGNYRNSTPAILLFDRVLTSSNWVIADGSDALVSKLLEQEQFWYHYSGENFGRRSQQARYWLNSFYDKLESWATHPNGVSFFIRYLSEAPKYASYTPNHPYDKLSTRLSYDKDKPTSLWISNPKIGDLIDYLFCDRRQPGAHEAKRLMKHPNLLEHPRQVLWVQARELESLDERNALLQAV